MSANLADARESDDEVLESRPHVSELLAHFGSQELIDARQLLAERPEYTDFRSEVIDLAYEEFCRRADAGESIDHSAFAHRFPAVEQSLLRLLDVHQYVADDPDSFYANLWPEVGDDMLGFSLVEELGRGAFARVFLAREAELGDRAVVVKICGRPNDEAARLGQLSHQNIVPVYSVQTQPETGLTAICMPYLGSATLDDVIEKAFKTGQPPDRGTVVLAAANPADVTAVLENRKEVHWTLRRGSYAEAVIEIAAQLSDALASAHEKGIFHCDVKPSNVLVTANGQSKLFDFNLSLQRGGGAATVGGTLPYMAPEQVRYMIDGRPDKPPQIDQRTDVFSLGVSVFQVLTGSLPFAVDEPGKARKPAAQKLLEQQRTAAYSQSALEKLVGRRSARTIASCFAFDPNDRPETAETLARQLRSYLSPMRRTLRYFQTHKLVAAGLIVMLAIVVGVASHLVLRPPKDVRQYRDGMTALIERRWADAIDHFVTARTLNPELGEASLGLGWAKLKSQGITPKQDDCELLEGALDAFERADRQMHNAESAASLAYCCSLMDKHDTASKYFQKSIEFGSSSPAVLNNLGYNLCEDGNPEDAISELLDLPSDYRPAIYNLAIAERDLARKQIDALSYSIRLWGKKQREGDTAEAEGRMEDAEACFAEAEEQLEVAKAFILEAQDHIEDAVGYINKARTFPSMTAKMELTAAQIYATAILIDLQVSESNQTKVSLYRNDLFTSCEQVAYLKGQLEELYNTVFYWLESSTVLPEKKRERAKLLSELGKDSRYPNFETTVATPKVDAPWEGRLVDLYEEILPSMFELPSPHPPSAG